MDTKEQEQDKDDNNKGLAKYNSHKICISCKIKHIRKWKERTLMAIQNIFLKQQGYFNKNNITNAL